MTGPRFRPAAGALALAVFTAAAAALGAGADVRLALAYLIATLAALTWPAAIVLQVVAGLVLAATAMLGPDSADALLMAPLVMSIVATAELLAAAARLAEPGGALPRGDVRRAARSTVVAGVVYAAVAVLGALPGLTGLPAILIASAACLGLALLLFGRVQPAR